MTSFDKGLLRNSATAWTLENKSFKRKKENLFSLKQRQQKLHQQSIVCMCPFIGVSINLNLQSVSQLQSNTFLDVSAFAHVKVYVVSLIMSSSQAGGEFSHHVAYLFQIFILQKQHVRIVSVLPPPKDMVRPQIVKDCEITRQQRNEKVTSRFASQLFARLCYVIKSR